MAIERFEDLQSWQEGRALARAVYQLTRNATFDQDRDLRRQMRAAAVSPMGNIAEAHGRYSFEGKRRVLDIALGSCKETQSHCHVALDQGDITEDEFREVYPQGEVVGRMAAGMIANLERQIGTRQAVKKSARDIARRG
jgi:four helix bundle protein